MVMSFTDGNAGMISSRTREDSAKGATGLFRKIGSFLRREDGVTAIEFALIAPALAVGILALGLVSLYVYRHITLEQIVRVGVEAARTDPGADVVMRHMRAAALAKGYTPWALTDETERPEGSVLVMVGRGCGCPEEENPYGRICRWVCADGRPPTVGYSLWAQQDWWHQGLGYFEGLITLVGTTQIMDVRIRKDVFIR